VLQTDGRTGDSI